MKINGFERSNFCFLVKITDMQRAVTFRANERRIDNFNMLTLNCYFC